uniref:PawS-like protein 1a n=1 Tax=Ligularia przewalskii TaxID=186956 RepID=A0A1V0JB48_9ASTR|nr:PawS-like protein 1a [Ligularia przewalskii]
MAKLALVTLAFVAIVTISVVSAYRSTITTTTIEDNGMYRHSEDSLLDSRGSRPEQCRRQIPFQEVNHCQMHLMEGIDFDEKLKMVVDDIRRPMQEEHHLQQCCTQLKNLEQECQCDAIQEVFDEARQQGGGVIKMRQMLSKAQNLPNDCKLQVQECPLVSPRV